MLPIYYVITERLQVNPITYQYDIRLLLGVYACDMEEINDIWDREVNPIQAQGRQIYTQIYYREPSSPFERLALHPSQALPSTFITLPQFEHETVTPITEVKDKPPEDTYYQDVWNKE